VPRARIAAGQYDDFKFTRGVDLAEQDVGEMVRLTGGDDRARREPRHDRLDFRAT